MECLQELNDKGTCWCTVCRAAYRKRWYAANSDYNKQYYQNNKEKSKESTKCRRAERQKEDPSFKLAVVLRKRLLRAIKTNAKAGSAVKDLGCSVNDLKSYLESKFQPGMTWGNWGNDGWHLDHIKPLCKFDLTNIVQFKEACHYTNLQPLWKSDHLIKTKKDLNNGS